MTACTAVVYANVGSQFLFSTSLFGLVLFKDSKEIVLAKQVSLLTRFCAQVAIGQTGVNWTQTHEA